MRALLTNLRPFLVADAAADRVVPPSGFTVRLTLFTAAAMSFLAVFALALSLASGRLAQVWGEELAREATIRISAPKEEMKGQTAAALKLLEQTPGVVNAQALTPEEQKALLEPWFGPGLPIDDLPVPQLIRIEQSPEGYDSEGLRLRLQAEVPGAVLDEHGRWRKPLLVAAARLRLLGWIAIVLIGATMGAMVTLAANAALAANAQVISVLRLVGATDSYIAGAFVRRFTLRAFTGASMGTFMGLIAVAIMPGNSEAGSFLTGLRFEGLHWAWPLLVPPLSAAVAFVATQTAARRVLEGLS
ncbi:MAG: cell division protein FtsX [Pelagimonas sp.]|jgi:cell division transport system permease protein|nr:cell division protein FtsX [Pelagimonas sp.]